MIFVPKVASSWQNLVSGQLHYGGYKFHSFNLRFEIHRMRVTFIHFANILQTPEYYSQRAAQQLRSKSANRPHLSVQLISL